MCLANIPSGCKMRLSLEPGTCFAGESDWEGPSWGLQIVSKIALSRQRTVSVHT
jgi:hypothetical protein